MPGSEEKITLEMSLDEAETLIALFENYLIHYTEDDYYTGEMNVPLLLDRILAEIVIYD